MYCVIYDGLCNLCVTLVKLLEMLDGGSQFRYVPMQDEATLQTYRVSAADCELGMILIDQQHPERRWQGSDAAEEIGKILPLGAIFVAAYRALPGLKRAGDRIYAFIRDNRYQIFGKRQQVYQSAHPLCTDRCDRYFSPTPSADATAPKKSPRSDRAG
ncbi:MAG: DUF393 domain-containing protein [Leptolyngbya sp. SIO4C1]|nr:DUF393 domain-containing protein [Leptolyngbya sp. SIO4C1]